MSGGILASIVRVGSNTTLSRVLGLVRDIVIARTFGASESADAFFVAFRIPNLFRRFFAEGAFSQAFVPVLAEYREQRGEAAVNDLVAHVAGMLGAVLLTVTAIGMLGAPVLIMIFAPGFIDSDASSEGGDRYQLAVEMVRITFPYLFFISLTSFAGGILNTYGRFGVPAFTPVLLNLSLIGCALWLAPGLEQPGLALAIGVFIAGVVQLTFQLPFLAALGKLVRPRLSRAHAGVRQILRLVGPALFGASVQQINLLIDTLIASFLVTGSIAWLYYSDRMVEFPLGVFGIALATVILPGLSGRHAKGEGAGFSQMLDWALRLVVLIAVPASVGLAVLATPILTTLFNYGDFGSYDVAMASRSLVAYSVGLLGFIAVKTLAPGYFARQDTRTPVRVGLVAMAANLVLNLLLVWPLAHAGLALATALAAYVNAGLLLRGLRRDGIYSPGPGWKGLTLRVVAGCAVMGSGLLLFQGPAAAWTDFSVLERVGRLTALVVGGGLAYGVTLLALGLRPASFRQP